ncbi:MAG: hypothetical protein GY795_21715 [Desulfobacterales bacterium]|nr:hypothetical protein [Desulfobacterales bacterium]
MSYKLIKGEFHIFYSNNPRQGPEPDGDTLKFLPDDPKLVESLHRPGSAVPNFNNHKMINIRFEGIDALELHFNDMHQNLELAEAARNFVLKEAGFDEVKFLDDLPFKVENAKPHPTRGYIYASSLDEHGRIIAFVHPGNTGQVDGVDTWVDVATMEQSLNARLLKERLVYPAFYRSLPIELKDRLAELTVQARGNNDYGIWSNPESHVNQQIDIPDLDTLQDKIIWPKLFRRLASYFVAGHQDLGQFDSWLRADPKNRDDQLILPNRDVINMHDLIEINGDRIRMLHPPEEIIIWSDDVPQPQHRVEPNVRVIAALVNPTGSDDLGRETVTLLNASPDSVNLNEWTIADKQNKRHTLHGTLEPGDVQRVTLSEVRLGNQGDTITLFNAQDEKIDQVFYTKKQVQRQGWTIVF